MYKEKISGCAKNVTKIMHKFLWWVKNGRGQVGQSGEEAECEVLV